MDGTRLAGLLAWGGLREVPARARFLVAEALDDFPGQASDAALLDERPGDVLEGTRVLAEATGAREPVVVVPADGAAALPGCDDAGGVTVVAAPRLHPLGHPRLLGRWLSSRPRFDGTGPGDFAVVAASDAVAAVAAARGRPRVDRWITVAGRVREPGTFLVPMGTPVAALVRLAGGTTGPAKPYLVRRGGLRPAGSSRGVGRDDGTLLMLGAGHVLARNDALPLDVLLRRADSVCDRCGLCDTACPTDAVPALLLDALRAARAAGPRLPERIAACVGCRACETVCPTGLGIGRLADLVASRVRAAGVRTPSPGVPRLMPREAMRRRLDLGTDPRLRRDARGEIRRVRLPLDSPAGEFRALRRRGDLVWAGEPVAVGPAEVRSLAPFAGTILSVDRAVTIRRMEP